MFIRLETSSGVPITRQIADQIRARCASGALSPGDRLPSVRALAAELAVNPNTILLVYERLETEGLLERRHGDGTYVAQSLPAGQARQQREALSADADRLVVRASALGLTLAEVQAVVERAWRRPAARSREESR